MSAFTPHTQEQLIAAAGPLGQENLQKPHRIALRQSWVEVTQSRQAVAGEGGGYVSLFRRAGMELPYGEEFDQEREFAAIYPYRDRAGTLLFARFSQIEGYKC